MARRSSTAPPPLFPKLSTNVLVPLEYHPLDERKKKKKRKKKKVFFFFVNRAEVNGAVGF